jgi:twinkle protein
MTKIYLALDTDEPGVRTRDELARRFGAERCWTVLYPDGCKDANDVLVKFGSVALAECIHKAVPYPVEGVLSVNDLTEGFWDLRRHGLAGGAKLDLGEFDEYITWGTPALTVVTGAPNSGKSPLFDMISVLLMTKHDWRVAYFTPENHPTEIHLARLVEQVVGQPSSAQFNNCATDEEVTSTLDYLQDRVHYILPTSESYTVEMVLEKADFLVRRYGVKMVIVDPWNFFEHQYGSDSETLYTSKCLNRMRTFARRRGVHLVVVAHPRKLQKNKDGTWPFATMYDISGSASWYSMADFGLSIERVRENNQELYTTVHVLKVKHSHMGMLGDFRLTFEVANKRYRRFNTPDDRQALIPLPKAIRRSSPNAPAPTTSTPEVWTPAYADDEQPF